MFEEWVATQPPFAILDLDMSMLETVFHKELALLMLGTYAKCFGGTVDILLVGPPATGKSHLMQCVQDLCVPGEVVRTMNCSSNTLTVIWDGDHHANPVFTTKGQKYMTSNMSAENARLWTADHVVVREIPLMSFIADTSPEIATLWRWSKVLAERVCAQALLPGMDNVLLVWPTLDNERKMERFRTLVFCLVVHTVVYRLFFTQEFFPKGTKVEDKQIYFARKMLKVHQVHITSMVEMVSGTFFMC
jgi:hypothetical protein